MITHKTKSGEIYLEEVNETYYQNCTPEECNGWQRFSDISEQQAAEIVDGKMKETRYPTIMGGGHRSWEKFYMNYVEKTYWRGSSFSALDSLRSLIESYKLNPDKVVIIKKG